MGIRVDWGQKFQDQTTKAWGRNIVLQLNKDADNPAIKQAAGRNGTHSKRLIVFLPLNDDGTAINASVDKDVFKTQVIDKLDGGV